MDKVIIKCVGKKINISNNDILIDKTIGKNILINIDKVVDIDYTIATPSMNGVISISFKDDKDNFKIENSMFRYMHNDIVRSIIEDIRLKKGLEIKDKVINKSVNIEQKEEENVCCPKCGSSQLSANKKGFSLGKAVVGGLVLVPVAGVVTGMIGKNKIIITCLRCGKQFKPGN